MKKIYAKSCKTCTHAEWEKTRNGRKQYKLGGKCTYYLIPEVMLEIVRVTNVRFTISRHTGKKCMCYEHEQYENRIMYRKNDKLIIG